MSPYRVAVAVPVELGEVAVALELADDARRGRGRAAARETSSQRSSSPPSSPMRSNEFPAARLGQAPQQVEGAGEHPGGGDVGVRVVVEARAVRRPGRRRGTRRGRRRRGCGSGPRLGVVDGGVRPEAGDLQQHLGALGVQELGVAAGLAVLPHVVRDRRADVVLEPGVVGQPAARARVEVQLLGLLAAVAAALPGVHGPGPARVARPRGRPASRRRWR